MLQKGVEDKHFALVLSTENKNERFADFQQKSMNVSMNIYFFFQLFVCKAMTPYEDIT